MKSLVISIVTIVLLLCLAPAGMSQNIDNSLPSSGFNKAAIRIPHGATRGSWSDDFNRADGTNMGADWTETEGDLGIQSNQGVGLSSDHSKMQHTSASMAYADSLSSVEFYNTTGTIVYTALIAGWGTDGVFVKVQDNTSDGYYDRVFFYNVATGSYWTGSTYFDLAVPTLSGVATLYFTNGGDTANFDIDRDFDDVVDEHFECSGVTTMGGLGTGFGIGTYKQPAFDNWEAGTPGVASVPFYDGFESGSFGSYWATATTNNGRIQITTNNTPIDTYHVTMDAYPTGTYSNVTMTLSIDLSSVTEVDLEFMWKEFGDEPHYDDGIFISDDDVTYHKALDLSGGTATYTKKILDLDQAASAAGISLTSDFKIRFSQYDNYAIASDGFAFDEIKVEVPIVAATVPFYDGFESGSFGPYWETDTTGAGRIQITTANTPIDTYHVTMDSSTNGTNSTGTMTLTVDLLTVPECNLEFMWKEFGDESDSEDGVFISDDDITYHKALDLWDGTDTYMLKTLDIDLAASNAGISLTSDFKIRFSWKDNYGIPTDGFAFDEIKVEAPPNMGSLTTLFAQNNGSQGNTFDIIPYWDIEEIMGIDINTSATSAVSVDVYYKSGTCVGYETNPGAWTLLASGTGTGQGSDNHTYIDLPGAAGVSFSGGLTYGMYVDVVTGGLKYTNGGPTTYSNSDLSLITNSGQGGTFSSTFYPRQWNGTVYYKLGPDLVELVSFVAAGYKRTAVVKWETASEIDNAGFHIWRRKNQISGESEFTRITDHLIPSKGGPTHGASYIHIDRGVDPGRPYWYRLEDISNNGRSMLHDPVLIRWWAPETGGGQ